MTGTSSIYFAENRDFKLTIENLWTKIMAKT